MKIKAYAFEAGCYCPDCARAAWKDGRFSEDPEGHAAADEHGLPQNLVDSEGNPLGVIFAWHEVPEEGIACEGCSDIIEEPRMGTAHFDRFSIEMPLEAARDCTKPGPAHAGVAYWLERLGIDWDAIEAQDIRDELKAYGAWDSEELEDEKRNRARILWIAAAIVREQ